MSIRPRRKNTFPSTLNLGKGCFILQGFDFIVHPRSPGAVRLLLKYASRHVIDYQFFLIVLGPSELVLCAYTVMGRVPVNVIDHVHPLPKNSTSNPVPLVSPGS